MASDPNPNPSGPGAATVVVLGTILGFLTNVSDTLKQNFTAVADSGKKLMWGTHIPELARAIADMMDLAPQLFSWAPITAAALRTLEGEVLLLTEVKAFLDTLASSVGDLLASRRDDLYGKATDITDGLNKVLLSPLTPPEMRSKLEEISKAVTSIVEKRNKAIASNRKDKKKVVAGAQAEVDRLTAENQVLRGQVPTAPAGKKSSKKKK